MEWGTASTDEGIPRRYGCHVVQEERPRFTSLKRCGYELRQSRGTLGDLREKERGDDKKIARARASFRD